MWSMMSLTLFLTKKNINIKLMSLLSLLISFVMIFSGFLKVSQLEELEFEYVLSFFLCYLFLLFSIIFLKNSNSNKQELIDFDE